MTKMYINRTVVEQALEAFRMCVPMDGRHAEVDAAFRNLRTALAQAAPEPETCTWWQDGDSDSGLYGTSCRHYFNLEDGTPEDNRMQWCCYCGKKLAPSSKQAGRRIMGKPDAQSMADALMETHPYPLDIKQAAAELRRLSAENAMLWGEREEPHAKITMYIGEWYRLETERDALLEALQDLCDTLGECGMTEKARATIKAVEETK